MNYNVISISYKFTSEQLHYDYDTCEFVYVTKKTKRSFAGLSPKKAYRLLVKSEKEKGSIVKKVTGMYIRDNKLNWHTIVERK